jgi:hypothetical protein
MMKLLVALSFLVYAVSASSIYPVPTPAGGRMDVHGWLILPIELHAETGNETRLVRPAWFSHHVPEFWHDSPHNFQIIFRGTITPTQAVFPSAPLQPLGLPTPAGDDLLTYEYSITPPSAFSLNDLLNGDIKALYGVYYNGSFDTPYDRIPESLSVATVEHLTTAVYLDEFEDRGFPNLAYLSYPRALQEISKHESDHVYLAHNIHAQPDFDHVVHGRISDCSSSGKKIQVSKVIKRPGISWEVVGIPNTLENKLKAGQVVSIHSMEDTEVTCQLTVLESIHCMIGPGFMDNC